MNAIKLESEALEMYRELEAWFTDRNYDELAKLCSRLATWHRDAYARIVDEDDLMSLDALRAAAVPWVGLGSVSARPREFAWRLASPVQLLELALESEHSEECSARLRSAIGKLGPVNWESALDSGGGPALALGAERRYSR
jgi:hypothetical protein